MQIQAPEADSLLNKIASKPKAGILALILGIVLLLLLALGFTLAQTITRALHDANRDVLLSTTTVAGNRIAEQLLSAKTEVDFAASLPGIRATLTPEEKGSASTREEFVQSVNAKLNQLQEANEHFEMLFVSSKEGATMACSQASLVGTYNVYNHLWFQKAISTAKTVLSAPFRSPHSGNALMIFATPFTQQGSTGIVAGALHIQRATRHIFEEQQKPWLKTVIIDSSGMTVASLDDQEIAIRSYARAPWLSKLSGNVQGVMPITYAGTETSLAFYHLPGTPFFALSIADASHLQAQARKIYAISIAALLLVIFCFCGLLYYVSPMTHNIRHLTMVAEEATRARNDFLARMSHEIRTLTNAITGMAYLGLQSPSGVKQHECFTKIQQAGETLVTILDDILDFSDLKTGKLQLQAVPFRLSGVLRSVTDLLDGKARANGGTLRMDVADDVPDVLIGDSLRLSQICLTLCENALTLAAKGKTVVMHIVSENIPDGPFLLFRFTISGHESVISDEQKAAFGRKNLTAVHRRYSGVELKLAVCSHLVTMMGGFIHLENAPEQGNTIHFTVRLRPGSETELRRPRLFGSSHAPHGTTDDLRVLLVEDNELNQEVAAELLRLTGITPTIANNGVEAVALCEKQSFDLIFMDIQMPLMDGLEATRRIRAGNTPNALTVPIIAMTAKAMSGDREKSIAAGMDDHITKPVNYAELQEAIRYWTERS